MCILILLSGHWNFQALISIEQSLKILYNQVDTLLILWRP